MQKPKVVLYSVLVEEPTIEKNIFPEEEYNLVFIPIAQKDKFLKEVVDADGLVTADTKITKEIIESMQKCRVIARQGIGVDNINLEEATKKDIAVANVPDYCLSEVSDYAMALILSTARNITLYNKHVREGIWDIQSITKVNSLPTMRRLSTQTLGLLGYGKIAREVARKAKAFNFRIITHDPYIKEINDPQVALVDFETLIKESDILSIHSPLTEETRHLFDLDVFNKMKNTSILINTSRGPLIDENALYKALRYRKIAAAAIDVTEKEPLSVDSPLFELDNLIVTPHAAFFTQDSFDEMRIRAANEVKRVLANKEPENRVNK